jgi:signal transduction histidine kinase
LSHDLLAPLISIQGFVAKLERLYGVHFDEKGQHCVNRIKANIGFMDSLIKALLDTSRIINNNLNLQRTDITDLVQNVLTQHAASIESSGIKVDLRPTMPPAFCDVVRTGQLFSNLIGNAIKFGGKTPNLKITIGFENGAYYVADNGPGIPPEFRGSMFRAFTRFADKDVPGLGMGLNIVHEIVEKHGGEIWLDTSHAPGTRLCFTLPTTNDG